MQAESRPSKGGVLRKDDERLALRAVAGLALSKLGPTGTSISTTRETASTLDKTKNSQSTSESHSQQGGGSDNR
jgi:hypothetical protein